MAEQHILQVSELTKKVKFMLESELNTVWLCGEISNFITASSGHWYLSLKDAKSQVKCAMFKGSNHRVRIRPRNGQQVLVRAKVSLYEPRGDFQLIIELMEDAGEGVLRQQYEQLKHSLNAQGLFAQQNKQPLPSSINTVGIITSPTGAAVKDILSVLKRRNPAISIIIYPALVQGELAKDELVSAIAQANQRKECDVLIVGRGGGSLEDLWPFNEEQVVRAIYQSQLPVISAVGHEIDTTLSDYVADIRAATPSAAAEIVSSDIDEFIKRLSHYQRQVTHLGIQKLNHSKQQLSHLVHRLYQSHPEQQLRYGQQRADELKIRLLKAINTQLKIAALRPKPLTERLLNQSPSKQILGQHSIVEQLQQRLTFAQNKLLSRKQEQFAATIEQLHIVSPLATIARGYSVTRNKQGKIVKSVNDLASGDSISIQVQDGNIQATVNRVNLD